VSAEPLRLRLLLERLRAAGVDPVDGRTRREGRGRRARDRGDIGGLLVKVCSLDDLLAMKRAGDRPRDRDDLEALEAARESDD
jgi:hypothetical protein